MKLLNKLYEKVCKEGSVSELKNFSKKNKDWSFENGYIASDSNSYIIALIDNSYIEDSLDNYGPNDSFYKKLKSSKNKYVVSSLSSSGSNDKIFSTLTDAVKFANK